MINRTKGSNVAKATGVTGTYPKERNRPEDK
jgi:hypothetical protein